MSDLWKHDTLEKMIYCWNGEACLYSQRVQLKIGGWPRPWTLYRLYDQLNVMISNPFNSSSFLPLTLLFPRYTSSLVLLYNESLCGVAYWGDSQKNTEASYVWVLMFWEPSKKSRYMHANCAYIRQVAVEPCYTITNLVSWILRPYKVEICLSAQQKIWASNIFIQHPTI